jgi:hypothetical protein
VPDRPQAYDPDAVEATATLTDQVHVRNVVRVRARSSSFPTWRTNRLRAEPGDRITVQSFLERPRGDTTMVQSVLRAPRRLGRATLIVRGGGAGFFEDEFFLLELGGAPSEPSLEEVLTDIEERERSDELVVEIRRPGQAEARIRTVTPLEDVIRGVKRLGLRLVRR